MLVSKHFLAIYFASFITASSTLAGHYNCTDLFLGATELAPSILSPMEREAESAYRYADYKGPNNVVLEKLLNASPTTRDLKKANIGKRGKVFRWDQVLKSAGVAIDAENDGHPLRVFVNAADPMTPVTTRANFVQGPYPMYVEKIANWILEQYPELNELVKASRAAADKHNDENIKIVKNWIEHHPAYKNGVLILPRPTLWNRVAEQAQKLLDDGQYEKSQPITEAIRSGKEYFIETVACLFDAKLAEENFDSLNAMLVHLAGPHVARLSQVGTIKTIARWVITQYPELKLLTDGSARGKDNDSLTDLFGRTLGLIPVEWATGDLRTAMPLIADLEELPAEWEANVLPKLIKFIRGQVVPLQKKAPFELKDPVTGKRRTLRAGDEVVLLFKPTGLIPGDVGYLSQHAVMGVVDSVVLDHGEMVGVQIRHSKREQDENPYSRLLGFYEKPAVYWLSDFEVEDSLIVNSGNGLEVTVEFSSFKFPEDSGEVTLRYYASEMQVPISVGDLVLLYVKRPGDSFGTHVDVIVTGFVRDEEARVIAVKGYSDTNYAFRNISGITRSENGMPISIEREQLINDQTRSGVVNKNSIILADKFKEDVFLLEHVIRTEPGTHHNFGKNGSTYFRQPQSPKRAKYDHLFAWSKSRIVTPALRYDTGDFMLPIGRGEASFQAPIASGDEVLLHVLTPGTFLGFRYDRVLVTEIIFEGQKVTGIRGINFGAKYESSWQLNSILVEDSYIETNGCFGERANTIPGAFTKKKPHQTGQHRGFGFDNFFGGFSDGQNEKNSNKTYEDIFGYRYTSFNDKIVTAAWSDRPVNFDDWLELNRIAKRSDLQVDWAYWVLQIAALTPMTEVTKAYRRLASKYHPDRPEGDAEIMKLINEAYQRIERLYGG